MLSPGTVINGKGKLMSQWIKFGELCMLCNINLPNLPSDTNIDKDITFENYGRIQLIVIKEKKNTTILSKHYWHY